MSAPVTDQEPRLAGAPLKSPQKPVGPNRRAPTHERRKAAGGSCLRETLLSVLVIVFMLAATVGIVVTVSIISTQTLTFGYPPEEVPKLAMEFIHELKRELLPSAWIPQIGREGRGAKSSGMAIGSYGNLPVMTATQLAEHDGSNPHLSILLSITGLIFDVSSGSQHYKKGASYNFLTGKDASVSFVTGCFSDECFASQKVGWDAVDSDGRRTINDWLKSYQEKYILKARLQDVYEKYHSNDPAQQHQKFFTPLKAKTSKKAK